MSGDRVLHTLIADAIGFAPPPPPLVLYFDVPVEDRRDQEQDTRILYRTEAERVVAAIAGSAPGGLLDALAVVLLERKASALRVVAPRPPLGGLAGRVEELVEAYTRDVQGDSVFEVLDGFAKWLARRERTVLETSGGRP